MKHKRRATNLLAIALLLLMALLWVATSQGISMSLTWPEALPTPSPYGGWMVYVDEAWGYSIGYPVDWEAQITFTNSNNHPPYFRQRMDLLGPNDAEIIVAVWQKQADMKLMDWIDENERQSLEFSGVELPPTTNAVIDRQDALVISLTRSCTPQIFFAYIDAADRVLLVRYTTRDGGKALDVYRTILGSVSIEVLTVPLKSKEDTMPELTFITGDDECELDIWDTSCCGYPEVTRWRCSRDKVTHIQRGNCVYWAAYKRPDIGNTVAAQAPPGQGHAGNWAYYAQQAGCDVDTTPWVGDIMVIENLAQPDLGHVAYVRSVNGSTVNVTEMNYCTICPERPWTYQSSGKKFIHGCGGPTPTSTPGPGPTPTSTPIIPTPTSPPPPPPGSWQVRYFNDLNLGGAECKQEGFNGPYVFLDWGDDSPGGSCNSEFSARIWRMERMHFENADYTFYLFADDHAKLEILGAPGGDLIIDQWDKTQHIEGRHMYDGDYEVRVQYNDTGGRAVVGAWWTGPGFPAMPQESPDPYQWFGEYWGNRHWWENPVFKRNEGNELPLNRNWGYEGPGYGLPTDKFATRFSRTIYFDCGRYRFELNADDYAELWLDPDLSPPLLQFSGFGYQSREVDVPAGFHRVRVDHREEGGAAHVWVNWTLLSPCPTPTPTITPTPDTEKPVVNWIAPVGNEQVYPCENEVIQLEVSATDNVGVSRVRFFRWDHPNQEFVEIGNDYTAPYQKSLDCSMLNYGWNQTLSEAYDTAGNKSDWKWIWLDRVTPTPTPTNTPTPTSTPTVEPVANDDFDSALCVDWLDTTYYQQTYGATVASGDPAMSCIQGAQGANTVWYRFVSPDSGTLHLDTFGSDYDTVLAVYTGPLSSLLEVGCDDNTQGLQSALNIPVVAGRVYHVQVASYPDSDGGNLQLSVEYTPPPGCSEFMQNGNFEQGTRSCPWEQSSSGGYELISPWGWPRSGSYAAWFGGYNNAYDVMSQIVTIPDNATSATLTFWWYMATTELGASSDALDSSKALGLRTKRQDRGDRSPQGFEATAKTSGPHDYLKIWLRVYAPDWPLAPLQTITDQSTQGMWTLSRFDLEVAVNTYILYFIATTDASNWTNFFVDDVSLVVCTSCAFDFDGSGAVDTADIMRVASRWRTSCAKPDPDNNPDTPNYDPFYDVDGDCDIDVVDIMKVVARWGPCE